MPTTINKLLVEFALRSLNRELQEDLCAIHLQAIGVCSRTLLDGCVARWSAALNNRIAQRQIKAIATSSTEHRPQQQIRHIS